MGKTKQSKRVWCMVLILAIVASILRFQTSALEVNAAEEKYYPIEYGQDVKIGNYYYRIDVDTNNFQNILQRKKAGAKKYETIIKNIYGKCFATAKKIYYVIYQNNNDASYSTLYQCNMEGKKKKNIAKVKENIELGAVYNGKFYVSAGNEWAGYTTYTITKDGKRKLEKKELRVYRGSGQYMVGSVAEPTDVSPSDLCIYNAKTKKKIKLGAGLAPRIIKKKVYYASFDYKKGCYSIKSCNVNGKKQKTIATLPKNCIYVSYVCDKYVFYQTMDSEGNLEEGTKLEY